MTPTELVNAILKAPVDLLYNGGIGTYVKASERDARAGRRSRQRRAARQRPRASLQGRRRRRQPRLHAVGPHRIRARRRTHLHRRDRQLRPASTPSDHEVNIKILLGLPIIDGELTEKQRNTLLAEMTDDVAALVLRDNYFQTQALSAMNRIAPQLLDAQQRFIHYLEEMRRLNRALEYLPTDEEIAERRHQGHRPDGRPRAPSARVQQDLAVRRARWPRGFPTTAWVETALVALFPEARCASAMPPTCRAIR